MLSLRRKMQFWEAHFGLARWCARVVHAPLIPLRFYVEPRVWFSSQSVEYVLASVVWPFPRPLEAFHALPSINRLVCINDFLILVENKFLFLLHVWPFSFYDSICNSISSINISRSWLLANVNHYYCSKIFCHHICDHDPLSVSLLNVNSYFVCIAI